MTADRKSKKTRDGLHFKVKLSTEAEMKQADAQDSGLPPQTEAMNKAVEAITGEPTPPPGPTTIEWIEDDTYRDTVEALNEAARLAERGRYALTAEEAREMSSSGSKWMTYDEVAEHLSVAVGTVRNWVSARRIPFSKRGGMVRFKREDIDKWVEKNTTRRRRKP